ncbi:aminotransferase class III-fold pyridoxal phosphate-dependent enzyme [Porphyromonas macacae]|uniref:aminotransferase class III-fold pyridoxal phosphate-dependent enzyme n=1 Tax=Porphyromonas macacae TaxID=28115 RepID=UPI000A538C3D
MQQTERLSTLQLLDLDRKHLWHPYTSTIDPLPVYPVSHAEGVHIYLEDGTDLIDGMSSWWAAIHGYNHPRLNEALKRQAEQMSHIMFGGFTHRPAVELAQLLLSILPSELNKIFYADSGSVAVEVALKMALQYQQSLGQDKKKHFCTIRSGYHGDTWHAMSVCDPVTGMHGIFSGTLPVQYFLPQPKSRFHGEWDPADISFTRTHRNQRTRVGSSDFRACCARSRRHVFLSSAVPAGSTKTLLRCRHPAYLRRDCHRFRTNGRTFCLPSCRSAPRYHVYRQSLTGGYMTLSATIATTPVADTICSGEAGCFMHGPTFMGNPMACAVAKESISILLEQPWQNVVKGIESQLEAELAPARKLRSVKEVRVLGAIGVLEMNEPVNMARLQKKFVAAGIWVRPFGRLCYLMPPFIIKPDELSRLTYELLNVLKSEE